ncbi:O-antigen ligase family protein [Puniceicoccaceae bacterium K14]|nr:O-antigen ligase family protein [Puniceicoccaceae bacterium K14]
MIIAAIMAGSQPRRGSFKLWKHCESWIRLACFLIAVGALTAAVTDINLAGAILTLRPLIFLPLLVLWIGPRMGEISILKFAQVAAILCFANGFLGLVQSGLPGSHVLNRYATDDIKYIAEMGAGVRATGTFSYLTGLTIMSSMGIWAGMVLLSVRSRGWKPLALGVAGILGAFACAVSSGSRSPIVIGFAMLFIWTLGSAQAWKAIWRMACLSLFALLLSILILPSVAERFHAMGDGLIDRFENSDSNTHRAFGQWEEVYHAASFHPFGRNLGGLQVGGHYASTGRMDLVDYESQFPRIIAETGILGFVGFIVLVAGMILALELYRTQTRDHGGRLAIRAGQVLIGGLSYSSMVYNHTGSSFIFLVLLVSLSNKFSWRKRRLT